MVFGPAVLARFAEDRMPEPEGFRCFEGHGNRVVFLLLMFTP
jgi:hypothetical protein